MGRRLFALGFGLLLSLGSATAHAEALPKYPVCDPKKPPTDQQSQEAFTVYQRGKGRFDEAEYERALVFFNEAYQLDCTKHELLIIIARSHELTGRRAEAVHALETYLARVPNASDGETHRKRIENLKREIANAPKPPPVAAAPVPMPVQPPPVEPDRGHTVYPWIVVGIGGLATIVGGAIAIAGNSSIPEGCNIVKRSCEDQADNAGAEKASNLFVTGLVVTGVGLLTVGGGLTWHFLEPTGPRSQSLTIRPTLGRENAGAALSGTF